MIPPTVVHCKKSFYDIYIGRPSSLGNPFIIGRDGTRKEVCDKYEAWIEEWIVEGKDKVIGNQSNRWIAEYLKELDGKILGGWCWPRLCHGVVLRRLFIKYVMGS